MQINGNLTANDVWTLHNKTNRTKEENEAYHSARRENPELDRALYDHDKAEIMGDMFGAETILKYILEYDLSEEEKDNLKEENPEAFDKLMQVGSEVDELKSQLSKAENQSEIRSILAGAMKDAIQKGQNDETYLKMKSMAINNFMDQHLKSNNQYIKRGISSINYNR